MNKRIRLFFKRLVSEMFLICLVFQAPMFGFVPRAASADEGLRAIHKDDIGWDDVDLETTARKSNVLFLIEATEVMSFTSKGVQPYVWRDAFFDTNWEEAADWPLTEKNFGYTVHDINRMMKEATFGMGSLPPAWRGMDLRQGRNLYGRERNAKNNFDFKQGDTLEQIIEKNKDKYYFPFADEEYSKKYLVGLYDKQETKLEIAYKNYMDIWPDNVLPSQYRYNAHGAAGYDMGHYGDLCRHTNTIIHNVGPALSDFNAIDYYGKKLPRYGVDYNGEPVLAKWGYTSSVKAAKAYPYALVFKDPQYWTKPPSSWDEDALVPNDSRMYQTKLVLWNLLSDKDTFKNLRIGMATTFLSPANLERSVQQRSLHQHGIAWDQNPDTNGVFKVFPFGANIRTKSYFDEEGRAYMNKSVPVDKWAGSEYVYSRRNPPMLNEMLGTKYPITSTAKLKELRDKIKISNKAGNVTYDYDKGFNTAKAADGKAYSRVRYENGTMRGSTTGEVEAFIHVHGQSYPLWHNYVTHANYMTMNDDGTEPDAWWSNGAVPALDTAIPDEGPGPGGREHDNLPLLFGKYNNTYTNAKNKSYRSAGEVWDRPMYKLMRRGSLWLPILDADYVWEKGGKKIDQIEKFKLWINGVADIKSAGRTVDTTWVEDTWDNVTDGLGAGSSHNPTADKRTQSNRDNQFYWYNDPEIGMAGQFGLAQAIFPDPTEYDYTPRHQKQKLELDRAYYRKKGYVWYSKRDVNVNYNYDFRRNSQEYDTTAYPRARFNRGSGEAAGSVLDFFSPKIGYSFKGSSVARDGDHADYLSTSLAQIWDTKGRHTIATTDLHKVSFPIRNACENNWVIVIASGAEPKVMDDAYTYHSWEAIKNLYDATDKNNKGGRKAAYEPVTRIKPRVLDKEPNAGTEKGRALTANDLETIDLDTPLRTLVIGIVAHPDDDDVNDNAAVRDDVMRMRDNLNKMARAGQGKDIDDKSVNAYFADDVQSLKEAVRDAITYIDIHEEQTGKGPMLETPSADDILNQDSSQYDFYYSSFKIRRDNVWEGYLKRLSIDEAQDGEPVVREKWELNKKLLGGRDASQGITWRNLVSWNGKEGSFARITRGSDEFKSFTGLSPQNVSATTLVPEKEKPFDNHAADLAFYDWFNGYERSYTQGKDFKRANILADLGQQGVAMLSDPPVGMGLPGYPEWAEKRNLGTNKQPPMMYLQTNDGILHAVEPETGNEIKAVIPPPMLLPSRLATMKTRVYDGGKLYWMDVEADESTLEEGDVTQKRANPSYLLDGALIAQRLPNSDGTTWHTYLFGALGRGGRGLYALNADSYANPSFLWYKEKIGAKLASMTKSESKPSSEQAPAGNEMFWMKLGLNSPKPAIGVTGDPKSMSSFIAMAGGFDDAADMSRNGRDGAVLMFIDPEDGSVIRGFGSGEVDSSMRVGQGEVGSAPYMGMMVSEPTLLRSEQGNAYAPYLTGAVYAADNRGSIFGLEMEKEQIGKKIAPISKNDWKLKTLATLQSRQELSSGLANSYAVPHGVTASRINGSIWLAGGTSDIYVTRNSKANPDGKLRNASQMIFSFKTEKSQSAVYTRDDLKALKADGRDVLAPGDTARGWRMDLLPAKGNNSAEYVSAKPLMVGRVMYIPTFVEKKMDITDPDALCDISPRTYGEARIYAVYTDSGAPYWDAVGRFSVIDGIKITGLSAPTRRGRRRVTGIYDNLTGKVPNTDKVPGSEHIPGTPIFHFDHNGGVNMKPGEDMIYYWIKE